MVQRDPDFWAKAVLARQELMNQHSANPDIITIDLGYAPAGCPTADSVVLRVFVTERWLQAHPDTYAAIQREVRGIPVCVIRGDGQSGS
ncbi:MAG: hypothetical protein DCC55_27405 [Chloroflexi bacterium]|nr:MAG: hypothetical protein DCC55_27405 [Chloroflexota bacterium]